MSRTVYVCPLAIAQAELAREGEVSRRGWSSTATPGVDDLVLFEAEWTSWKAREAFEAQVGVTPLGDPWEPVPAAAVPVLESFRVSLAPQRGAQTRKGLISNAIAAERDVSAVIDTTHTVMQALRKAAPHLVD